MVLCRSVFPIPPDINAVLRGEEPRPLHDDDGGDCCYAPDAGRAIALLMTAETLRHDTYNVSSGRLASNREFADALQAITPGRGSTSCPDGRTAPATTPISTPPGSPTTPASRRPSTSPRRSPTTSRGAPTTPAEGAHTCLTPTCAAYSTAPRSLTSPLSSQRLAPCRSPLDRRPRRPNRLPYRSKLAQSTQPAPRPSDGAVHRAHRQPVVRGRVVEWLEGDAAWEIIDQLSTKYTGAPNPRGQERVVVVIEPERQTVGVG
jgi:hypothetical protein